MDRKTYDKARRQGVPAGIAYRWAVTPDPPALEWSNDGNRAETERDGYQVRITVEPDEDQDISWLGEFTDDPDGAVKNPEYEHGRYKYFCPTHTLEERRRDLSALGWAKGPAEQEAREQIKRDAAMAVTLTEYVIGVHVWREGVELGSAYIGGCGIESEKDAEQTIHEYDLIGEAIAEANDTLETLCNEKGCTDA